MTSRHLFFKLLREDIRRKAWAAVLFGLSVFFALPVMMAIVLPEYQPEDYDTLALMMEKRTAQAQSILGFGDSYPMLMLILVIAAVVLGISAFSYLHNRKQVDFYHSLPMKRTLQFAVHLTTGFLIPAVLSLIGMGMAAATAVFNGIALTDLLLVMAESYLCHMLYYILVYVTVILAVMLTGTRIAAVLGCAVFFGYFPALHGIIEIFCQSYLDTYYGNKEGFWNRLLPRLSPVAAIFDAEGNGMTAGRAVCALTAIIILAGLSLWLYQKRPSEAAGKTMAFPRSKEPIKILLATAFGLCGAFFFAAIRDSLGWTIFGTVVGTVISHCTIEVIYHGDFKKLFIHEKTMVLCVAAALAAVLGFRYDVLGFDSYLPKENQIAYASIDFSQDYWVTYQMRGNLLGIDSRNYILEGGKTQKISEILQIAEEGIRISKMKEEEREEYCKDNSSRTNVYICYTMKNGKKKYRRYFVCLDHVMEAADAIYTEPAYKEALYQGLMLPKEEAAENMYYREAISGDNAKILQGTAGQRQAVFEAYREECLNLSFSRRREEAPVGELLLISDEVQNWIQEFYGGPDRMWTRNSYLYDGYFYPVYPSFHKTLQALKECGVEIGGLTKEEVVSMEITHLYEDHSDSVTYTEPEQIEQLLKTFVCYNAFNKNDLAERETDYQVWIMTRKRRDDGSQISGTFLKGTMPAFVSEDLSEAGGKS